MNYKIVYKNIKHGYVRLIESNFLELSVPYFLKWNNNFIDALLRKWEKFIKKHSNTKIQKIIPKKASQILIFWEYREISQKKAYEICYNEAKNILDDISNKLWVSYKKLYIKDMKSKWWSCSWINNISINYKLVHLPYKYLKYVVIHEACHLVEKNHSKNFWDLVEKYYPDYKNVMREMKCVLFV